MERAGGLQPLDAEHHLAGGARHLGVEVGDGAADHAPHQVAGRHVGDRVGRHVLAVAHHGDGVAELGDLVEAVRDEDDGVARVAQATRDREEPAHLDGAERRRRLVHDEQPGVQGDRLGDLDDLLVRDGQPLGRTVRVEVDAEVAEELPGPGPHGAAVDAAEPAERLPAQVDVLGDRQVGKARGLLVDDGDPGRLGLGRAAEVDGLAAELDHAGVAAVHAAHDLDQRGLARAVLPHERVDGAGLYDQGAGAERGHGSEGLGDPFQAQRRCGVLHVSPSSSAGGRH